MDESRITSVGKRERADNAISKSQNAPIPGRTKALIEPLAENATAGGDPHVQLSRDDTAEAVAGGGIVGAILGVATISIPVVGPLAATGSIAATAIPAGVAVGAAFGATLGVIGRLAERPSDRRQRRQNFGRKISRGGILASPDDGEAQPQGARARDEICRGRGGGMQVSNAGIPQESTVEKTYQITSDDRRDEQRSESRVATVFRPVFVETSEFSGFCLVRNLSSHGMKGEAYTSFVSHSPIAVHFSSDRVVRGHVIWCEEGRIGIQFNDAIDVAEVLSDLATRIVEGRVTRAPRVPIKCRGELIIGDRSLAIELEDISQRGAKISASFIRPGDEVSLQLEGLEPRTAEVRWTLRGHAGLKFVLPIPFEDLALWTINRSRAQHFHDHGARLAESSGYG